ncbi:MAG: hypothetical protein JXA33_17035 [Anaerolineae bacterium]|nr:hypothetical protein [Anaerolineae bacterium]
MENIDVAFEGKQVLILSDNDGLARAIEVNLVQRQPVKVVCVPAGGAEPRQRVADGCAFDLIVVAMSSPVNEPLVALARASLTRCIGRVPILVISDKPFKSGLDVQILHLDFPFAIDSLNERVRAILWGDLAAEQVEAQPALAAGMQVGV